MIRGGRVPDLPGVRYHVMRMKRDFMRLEDTDRMNKRSKYGVRNPNKSWDDFLNRRLTNKASRRIALRDKNIKKQDEKKMTEIIKRLRTNFLPLKI